MNFISVIQRIIKSVLFGTLIVVCICGCGKNTSEYVVSDTRRTEETEAVWDLETETSQEDFPIEETVTVYVCGEVSVPGVYTLPQGSRVCDAFSQAGGFSENAAKDYWNQARVLTDGEMIYVPTKEEAAERKIGLEETQGDTTDIRVNINTATKEELMTIPGIGEAKAMAIISYREKNGAFSKIEEIMEIEGIKEGVFAKIKDYIKIN